MSSRFGRLAAIVVGAAVTCLAGASVGAASALDDEYPLEPIQLGQSGSIGDDLVTGDVPIDTADDGDTDSQDIVAVTVQAGQFVLTPTVGLDAVAIEFNAE